MKFKKLFAILIATLSLLLLCACGGDGSVELSAKKEAEIVAAYAEKYEIDEEDVQFMCYGKFGRCYVLMYNGIYTMVIPAPLEVDGVTFYIGAAGQTFDVFYKGEFMDLREAFDQGLISHNQLVQLKYNYENQICYYNWTDSE